MGYVSFNFIIILFIIFILIINFKYYYQVYNLQFVNLLLVYKIMKQYSLLIQYMCLIQLLSRHEQLLSCRISILYSVYEQLLSKFFLSWPFLKLIVLFLDFIHQELMQLHQVLRLQGFLTMLLQQQCAASTHLTKDYL